jgi:transcriptional regulator with XRE-family HTH domain
MLSVPGLGSTVRRIMDIGESAVDRRASATASVFGSVIRSRRKELKMRQAQLAMATGVSRGFVIDLEAGKPSCQLGRSLLVAEALGLRPADILAACSSGPLTTSPELPDLLEEVEELNGHSTCIL